MLQRGICFPAFTLILLATLSAISLCLGSATPALRIESELQLLLKQQYGAPVELDGERSLDLTAADFAEPDTARLRTSLLLDTADFPIRLLLSQQDTVFEQVVLDVEDFTVQRAVDRHFPLQNCTLGQCDVIVQLWDSRTLLSSAEISIRRPQQASATDRQGLSGSSEVQHHGRQLLATDLSNGSAQSPSSAPPPSSSSPPLSSASPPPAGMPAPSSPSSRVSSAMPTSGAVAPAPASAPTGSSRIPPLPLHTPQLQHLLLLVWARAPALQPSIADALSPQQHSPALGPSSSSSLGQSPSAKAPFSAFGPSGLLLPQSPSPPGQDVTALTLAPQSASSFNLINPTTGMLEPISASALAANPTITLVTSNQDFVVRLQLEAANSGDLPASAFSVQNGEVTSVSPVAGSNGRLYDVGVRSNLKEQTVSISTAAGATLASGLALAASNRITVKVDTTRPQTRVTNTQRYNMATSASPAFLVDFGERVTEVDPLQLFTMTGTDRKDVVYNVERGQIYITGFIANLSAPVTVTVSVAAGVTTDLAGNPNTASSASYEYMPTSVAYTTTSKTVNGVFGGALGATMGASALASTGVASIGVAGTPGATFLALHMVTFGQLFYLMSNMAVPNLPMNFRQVSQSFSWTVLDIKLPWESSGSALPNEVDSGFPYPPVGISSNTFGPQEPNGHYFSLNGDGTASSSGAPSYSSGAARRLVHAQTAVPAWAGSRRLLQNANAPAPGPSASDASPASGGNDTLTIPGIGGNQQLVVTSTGLNNQTNLLGQGVSNRIQMVQDHALGASPWEKFFRTLFWMGIIFAAACVVHYLALALFAQQGWRPFVFMIFPRPQLFLIFLGLPSLIQAAAPLLASSGGSLVGGILIVTVLPLLFLGWAGYFIVIYLHQVQRRRAAFILDEDPVQDQKQERVKKRGCSLSDAFARVLLGPRMEEGGWRPLKRPDSQFIGRWGTLFEDNRGPPLVMRGATFEKDPVTGRCNRGTLEPHLGRPVVSFRNRAWYRHDLQAWSSALLIFKTLGFAIILNAYTSNTAWSQIILLMVLAVVYVMYLRFIRPNMERFDLATNIIGALMDVGTFICGIILLSMPDASAGFVSRVGVAMLVLQGISFVLFLLGAVLLINGAVSSLPLWRRLFPTPSDKLANAVHKVMIQDHGILARRYADRWMVKALGQGLGKRPLTRWEDPTRRPDFLRQLTFGTVSRQVGKRGMRNVPTPRVGSQNPFMRMVDEEPAPISRLQPNKSGRFPTSSAGNGHAPATGDQGASYISGPDASGVPHSKKQQYYPNVSGSSDPAAFGTFYPDIDGSQDQAPSSPTGQMAHRHRLFSGESSSHV
ncbi:hypothetical protein WJX73_003425 [Symbiochloris irregularis]|uniref:TRP C-terminal domain-containing protein n=1 Tax=Symbiochloris irregularis TaxID=706552 RepID=A0AAW1NV01_9CHLO